MSSDEDNAPIVARSKRQSRPPQWMEEVVHPSRALAHVEEAEKPKKYVYRLMNKHDVTVRLIKREVHVLWPDDGTWYRGIIRKCDPKQMSAYIFYPDTDEKEKADLRELISKGEIAFKEQRSVDHSCGDNEVEIGEEYFGRKQNDTFPTPSASPSVVSSDQGPGAGETSDSDFSLSSGQKNPKKSAKRRRGSSDDEALSGSSVDSDEAPLSQRMSTGGPSGDHRQPRASKAAMRRRAGQKARKAQQMEEEEDDDEAAQRLLARASGRPMGGSGGAKGSGGSRPLGRSGSSHDPEVRSKVRSAFQQALEMAAKEIEADDAVGARMLPSPSVVASALEDALVRLFGGTNKDYKTKMRTLHFNLKDPHNTELRAHVLRNDISPDAFVRMTATELASRELAEYRRKKEEEALKMSVLDAEAAAKFSTAAALDAAAGPVEKMKETFKDEEKETIAGVGLKEGYEEEKDEKKPVLELFSQGVAGPTSPRGMKKEEEGGATPGGGGGGGGAPIDWASVKAAAVEKATHIVPQNFSVDFPSQLDTEETENAMGLKKEGQESTVVNEREIAFFDTPEVPEDIECLRKCLLPCPDPTALSMDVWESDVIVQGVGSGSFYLEADALAGCGDLAALMGPGPLTVRGRVAITKIDSFLSELHLSKHRTATVGVLRGAREGGPEASPGAKQLADHYGKKERIGVAEPAAGTEIYIIPPCELATRLLKAARLVEPISVETALPGGIVELPADRMLAVAIHKKEMQAVPGTHRPVRKMHATTTAAATTAAAAASIPTTAGAVGAGAAAQLPPVPVFPGLSAGVNVGQQPQQQQPGSILPAGIDLSAISALAAAFGIQAPDSTAATAPSVPGSNGGPQPLQASSGALEHEPAKERKSRWETQDAATGISTGAGAGGFVHTAPVHTAPVQTAPPSALPIISAELAASLAQLPPANALGARPMMPLPPPGQQHQQQHQYPGGPPHFPMHQHDQHQHQHQHQQPPPMYGAPSPGPGAPGGYMDSGPPHQQHPQHPQHQHPQQQQHMGHSGYGAPLQYPMEYSHQGRGGGTNDRGRGRGRGRGRRPPRGGGRF